ncbi:MAG: S4 domain-containing protein [Pseudomonadota bacterium]|nr:S4 domain-containing protein [Pseudomonadota bacterium]
MGAPAEGSTKVRLDKWLWAARFFKTRTLAKAAVEGGKVHYNQQRTKPSRTVEIGATLLVRQGWDQKEVRVLGLSEQRGNATAAQALYAETPASAARREAAAAERRLERAAAGPIAPLHRPSKKQRRQIHRFQQRDSSD